MPINVGGLTWTLTHHALVRMEEMGITAETVALTLDQPEVDYVQPRRGGTRVAKRGDYSVVYDGVTRRVITVLLNEVEQWSRDEKKVEVTV